VQHGGRRIERDRLARTDGRIMPVAHAIRPLGPVDRHHVICEIRAETGILQNFRPHAVRRGSGVSEALEHYFGSGGRRHGQIPQKLSPSAVEQKCLK
jgi:hypothetical protein